MPIFCDFDGTISIQDATDYVLSRFADPLWEQIEEEWRRGLIGSAQCMQRQVALIRAAKEHLDAALDEIEIDPSFAPFSRFCHARGIFLTVISDGVDYFIQQILARYGLDTIPVIANHLAMSKVKECMGYHLTSPFNEATCSSFAGVCKCSAVRGVAGPRVYIGDGRSDFCVANKPDLVFAKGKLAEFCQQQAIEFIPYKEFGDIAQALTTTASDLLHRRLEAPIRGVA